MKNTGIIRKIDELGRIVLPKELRKALNINSGDDFQITIDDHIILLEKYSKLENFEDRIKEIISCFYSEKNKIYISINDKLINNGEKITNVVSNIINTRKLYYINKVERNIIANNTIVEGRLVILPIVLNSDLLGSIIVISHDSIDRIIEIAKIINNIIKKIIVNN